MLPACTAPRPRWCVPPPRVYSNNFSAAQNCYLTYSFHNW
ncbi:hypothetical protein E2C01_065064 [Portunus trituberculatus]|uniref:Uncharacterized protein n=1 Tax=Portunus trituberculatus TaxID=210409 RepID=A0A5B7HLJ1_PORTR|nr:hypothetical protein [Portunus trituberculatus]